MFEMFTERARKVVAIARQEAQRLNSEFIRTEHLLLGVLAEGGGVAFKALDQLGVTYLRVESELAKLRTPNPEPTVTLGQIPFSPNAKCALTLAGEARFELGHDVVGTEHLLLGLRRVSEGAASKILRDLIGDKDLVPAIRELLAGYVTHPLSRPHLLGECHGVRWMEQEVECGELYVSGLECRGAGFPDLLLLDLIAAARRLGHDPKHLGYAVTRDVRGLAKLEVTLRFKCPGEFTETRPPCPHTSPPSSGRVVSGDSKRE